MKKFLAGLAIIVLVVILAGPWLLTRLGAFLLVTDQPVEQADAVVVLSTGVDYLPRLMQAAELYRDQRVDQVVINGNRKTPVHRELEKRGYRSPHNWYDGSVSVLAFLGVDRGDIITVDAPEVYDTVSEAQTVGQALLGTGFNRLVITTSKFHTRRAISIWRHLYSDRYSLQVVAAKADPFAVDGWWRHGRQIRQVMAEYGAWLFYGGKRLWQ